MKSGRIGEGVRGKVSYNWIYTFVSGIILVICPVGVGYWITERWVSRVNSVA